MTLAAGLGSDVDQSYAQGGNLNSVTSETDFTRRMTTVYATDYKGIDLSRVVMQGRHRDEQEVQDSVERGTGIVNTLRDILTSVEPHIVTYGVGIWDLLLVV